MKKYLLTICPIFISITVFSQNIKVVEPEFAGVIIHVNDSIGSGIRLEQQSSYVKAKTSGAAYVPGASIFAKTKTKRYVKNCCSNILIPKNDKVNFIVKLKDNSYDPTTVIKLFKLVSDKETRSIELGSVSMAQGSKSNDINYITFNAKKYGVSSYLITIDKLDEGEYAFTLPESDDVFYLFGIKGLSNSPEKP